MESLKKVKGLKRFLIGLREQHNAKVEEEKLKNKVNLAHDQNPVLRYGNVIFMQFETEVGDSFGQTKPFEGILSGDGLTLDDVTVRSHSTLNKTTMERFLFRIDPPRLTQKERRLQRHREKLRDKREKEKIQKRLKEEEEKLKNGKANENEKDEDESENENKDDEDDHQDFEKKRVTNGDPVLYGSELRLFHLYSKGYLTIDPFKLSKEEECVKAKMTIEDSNYGRTKFFDPSNTKRPGEAVLSKDTVGISFVFASGFFLKVHEGSYQNDAMIVNAGKEESMFKINYYAPFGRSRDKKDGTLKNGHVIRLFNKDTEMYLGVQYDPVNYKIREQKIKNIGGDTDKLMTPNFQFSYYHREKMDDLKRTLQEDDKEDKDQDLEDDKEDVSMIQPQKAKENDVSTLWEVRISKSLQNEGIPNSTKTEKIVLFKNVLTGQFLYFDSECQMLKLKNLNERGTDPNQFGFFMKMKNNWAADNCIKYNNLITIKDRKSKNQISFYENGPEDYEIRVSNAQKGHFPFFMVESCGKENRIAAKIKNSNKLINKFYMNFGREKAKLGEKRPNTRKYSLCVENEARLDFRVDQMLLCLDSLISVFTQDIINNQVSSWKASDYIQRINTSFQGGKLQSSQKRLSENLIIQNLLGLYKLILHLIYLGLFGLKEMKKNRNYRALSQLLDRKDEILQSKLPPVFLKDYLDPLVEKMLIVFYLVEYNNVHTSLAILQNFSDFYYPLNFYRTHLDRILKESTANSELMGKRCRVAFKIILEDMNLPRVGRSQIKYQTFKLKLLKNLLENMRNARHDGDAQSFSYFLRKWKENVEKLYFFRFENLNNDYKTPILKFYVASQPPTKSTNLAHKLEDLRQNTFKYMRKAIIQSNIEGDFTTFLFKLSDISAPNRSSFKKYIQCYIDVKTMMWISNYEFKVELKEIEGLELDMQRGMLMNLCLNDDLGWRIKKSISDFVTDVYLNVEKYNYFTDIHDFSFFLQRIDLINSKSLQVNEIFTMRPVVFMNKEALKDHIEIEQAVTEESEEEEKSDVSFDEGLQVPIDLDGKEYFPLLHCEDFFRLLLTKLAKMVLSIPSPSEVTKSKDSVTKFLHKMKELKFLSKIVGQFMEIGFCRFDELKFILTIINNLLHNTKKILFGTRKEILGLCGSKERNKKNVDQAKSFKISAKLLSTITDSLESVNTYRSNLVMLLTIKFFNEMALRGQFSEELTNRFLKDQVNYLEVLGFENNTETLNRSIVSVEQMSQLKAMIASKMQNATESKKSVTKLEQMLTTLNCKMNELKIDQKTNLASDLMDILILSINPANKKKEDKDKANVKNTLMHFDDVYYIKILKKKILMVLEGYYSRGIKVLDQLIEFEYVFEDRSMMRVVDRLEVTPEEMADFNEAIIADFSKVLQKDDEFMKKVGALRSELQRHFESRVYFPKIQKLSQISKWSEPCATILFQLAEVLKKRKEKQKKEQKNSERESTKNSSKGSTKNKRKETETDSQSTNFNEPSEEERRVFFTIRDFFVLQMTNSEIEVLENNEDIRYLFLDVFMEWGLPCEEVLIELYHYLSEEDVISDIKLLFEYIDENNILYAFDQNKKQDVDLLLEDQMNLLRSCSKLDQYFNILRSFTNSTDTKLKGEYQTQILTNLLQSSLFSKLLDSGFMSTYVEYVSENLNSVGFSPRNPRINSVETLRDLSEKARNKIIDDPIELRKFNYERLVRVVTNMMDNALNLAADCLRNNVFAQLIFKSESDFNDILTIIKNEHTPLYLKIPFYRLIYDGYFRCEEPQYKKIINIFNLLINKDLFEVIQFFENQLQAKSGRLYNNIAKYAKLRLNKNGKEKSRKNEKDDKSENKREEESDHESDDESESEKDSEIDAGEEDSEFSEDERKDENDETNILDNRNAFLEDKKSNKNIWFSEREVGLFLTAKLRDGKLYGMIGAMADFTIFLVANIHMYRKNMFKTKELFSHFENLVGQIKKFMPDFKHYFGKQDYCHAMNLIGILEINTGVLLAECEEKKLSLLDYNEKTRSILRKRMEELGGSGGDMSNIVRATARNSGGTDLSGDIVGRYNQDIEGVNLISKMGQKGYGNQNSIINSILQEKNRKDNYDQDSPKNQLKLMMQRFQPGPQMSVVSNRTNDIPPMLMSPNPEVMASGFKQLANESGSNVIIRDQGIRNSRSLFKKVLELIRFCLASLRVSFELQMENLLDDGFKDLEEKLVKTLVTLVLEAIKTKYNFLISFQAKYDLKIELATMKWFVRQVRQRVFDEGEDILLDAADSFQNVRMDDFEVLLVCIKLQSLLYGESRWAGEILYHQENSFGELPSSSSNINPNTALSSPNSKKKRYPINVVQPHRKCLSSNFFDIIAKKSMKGKSLKKFISNVNMFRFLLEAIEVNVFGLQRFILQANHYVKVISHELYGFHLSDFYRIFKQKKLEKCLSSKQHRFLFVHSLKHASIQGLAVLNPGREPKTAKKIQSELSRRFVGLFALRLICSQKETLTVKAEAMELLYYLLLNGNAKIQKEFYMVIMENYEFLNIIECIESILKSCHKRILKGLKRIQREKNKGQFKDSSDSIFQRFSKINAYQMMGLTFKLLQVFTENCYSDFQNLFREQVFEDHRRNNNIIQLVIDIIISLGKYIIFDKKRAANEDEEKPNSDGTSSLGSETEEETNTKVDVVQNQKDTKNLKVFQTKGVVAAIKEIAKNGRSKYRHHEEVAISAEENQRIKELIHLGFYFVNDCMMGPNMANQKLINSNPGLINFCCSIIRRIRFQEDKNLSRCLLGEKDESDFTLFGDSVKLLLYATNGNIQLKHLGNIFNKPNIDMLKNKAKDIYEKVIQFNRNSLYSWRTCCLIEADDFEIEKKDLMIEPPNGSKKKKKKRGKNDPPEMISQREQLHESILKGNEFLLKMNLKKKKKKKLIDSNPKNCTPWECNESGRLINKLYIGIIEAGHDLFILMKKYEDLSQKELERGYTEYYDFYNKFYGHVEISKENKIQIARYTKPYHCHFHYDKDTIITDFEIEPYAEKIKNFMSRIKMYEAILLTRQNLYRSYLPLYYFIKYKDRIAFLFYLVLLVINSMLIIHVKHTIDGNFSIQGLDLRQGYSYFQNHLGGFSQVIFYLGSINVFLAFLLFVVNLFDNQRHIYSLKKLRVSRKKELNSIRKKQKFFRKMILSFQLWSTKGFMLHIQSLFSGINVYNLIILGISLMAMQISMIYPFLLLDLVQRSVTLKNIIQSISFNWKQLMSTMILTLIIMFIYATISFTYFPDHFKHESGAQWMNYCHSLSTCLITVVNNGLRAGGGLGDALGQPSLQDTRFALRYWVDFTFYILILIILLNIVFGIIIDTFGDMRNARNEWRDYLNTTCMICDLKKTEIDSAGEGYFRHINVSHSIEDYIYFMIYVRKKNLNDCDGLEQYVKSLNANKNYAFMPNQESFHCQGEDSFK